MPEIKTKQGRKYSPFEWWLSGIMLLVFAYFFFKPEAEPEYTTEQRELCRSELRAQASIPQTVSFHALGFSAGKGKTDGILRIRSDFSAKNAFGLELEFDGVCVFNSSKPDVFVRPKAN